MLENPALFCGQIVDLDRLAFEYLELAEKYPGADDSCMRAHLFKILFTGLAANTDLRDRMTKAIGINNFREIVAELNQWNCDPPQTFADRNRADLNREGRQGENAGECD